MAEPKKIFMLADDDKDDRLLFSMAVKDCCPGIDCYLVSNGEKAIDILKDQSKPFPSVLFLDINMPVMGGWECLDAIKKDPELKNLRVIMYSTSSHEKDISTAITKGAECFCVKPDDIENLKKLVKFVADNINNDLKAALSDTEFSFMKR
jgi:CheY-like chemotaxis protein